MGTVRNMLFIMCDQLRADYVSYNGHPTLHTLHIDALAARGVNFPRSDTHIPEAMPELPVQIRQVFADTELILHAGDLHCLAVLDWLEEIAPVLAARGNGDSGSGGRPVVPENPRLQEAQVVRYDGWTVGVVHEVLDPVEMPHWPIERTMQHYFGCHTDIIVCGHTHVEAIQRYGDVRVINPGSPTYPRNLQAQPGTVGILRLEEGHRADVTIYDLKTLQPYPALTIRLQ